MDLNFDALAVAPSTGGSTTFFPLGDYPFQITKVEPKQVKDKNTGLLEVTLTVTDGPYKGATQIDRFNLWSDSEKAKEIAFSQLSSLCRVTGRIRLTKDSDLVGGVGIATIGPQIINGVPSDKYSDVRQYKDVQGRVNGQGEPVAAPQPVAAAVAGGQAPGSPWQASQQPGAPSQGQMPWQTQAAPNGPPAQGWQTGQAAAPAATTPGGLPPWATPQQ